MSKYHVNPETMKVGICTAKPGNCPLGGDHFDTKESAQAYADKERANEHGILPGMPSDPKGPKKEKKVKCSKCKTNLVEVANDYKEEFCYDGTNGCACEGKATNSEFCDSCTQELFGVGRDEWLTWAD